MKLLDSIEIRGREEKRIELYQGDLTDLSPAEGFDLLVVSAFPNDYTPTSSSLIGALYQKGLSVEALSLIKDIDLRENFSCWLSREFSPQDPRLQFRRILCFEPLVRGSLPELVGDIFRALTPIVAEREDIKTIAIPVVTSGDQSYSVREMLNLLLEAALHWLEIGLPLDRIKMVTRSDTQVLDALQLFSEKKAEYLSQGNLIQSDKLNLHNKIIQGDKVIRSHDKLTLRNEIIQGGKLLTGDLIEKALRDEYDVFISYSRNNANDSEAFEKALRELRPGIRIFVDRKALNIGSAWQPEIFETLDKCRKVVALLSPDYLSSKVCKEEFNIAWIRSRETDEDIIFPVYLYTTQLPTYMKYRNYFDCREGDRSKIREASMELLNTLTGA